MPHNQSTTQQPRFLAVLSVKLLDLGNLLFAGIVVSDIFSENATKAMTIGFVMISCLYVISVIFYAIGTKNRYSVQGKSKKKEADHE